jgi:hypothetical protein
MRKAPQTAGLSSFTADASDATAAPRTAVHDRMKRISPFPLTTQS